MMGLVGMYIKYTHHSPELNQLVTEISELLDDSQTSELDFSRDQVAVLEWTDLLLQLHGVVTRDGATAAVLDGQENGFHDDWR